MKLTYSSTKDYELLLHKYPFIRLTLIIATKLLIPRGCPKEVEGPQLLPFQLDELEVATPILDIFCTSWTLGLL